MKTLWKIVIGVIAFIIVFTLIQKCAPQYIQGETRVETVIDSTAIDSLQQIIDYYESIPVAQRDTVRDTVYIPSPVFTSDSTTSYSTFHSDSTLDANIVTQLGLESSASRGYYPIMLNQEISYVVKRQRVIEKTNTITLTEYRTTRVTNTLIKSPRPYFSIGGHLDTGGEFGPSLSYTKPSEFQVQYQYNLNSGFHEIGFAIPIKF